MAIIDNRYSRFVAWAKVLLPLAALVLLSTLFLYTRQPSTEAKLPFVDAEEIAQVQRLTRPVFSGITLDGSIVTVRATEARPLGDTDAAEGFGAEGLRANLVAPDGSTILITATQGQLDPAEGIARLGGVARIETSTGYTAQTDSLEARLTAGEVEAESTIEITAPFGQLTAGGMIIATPEGASAPQLVFNRGVEMIYDPQD